MFSLLRRSMCRHETYWSERRRGHVCYRCGHVNAEIRPVARFGSEIPGFRR